MKYSYTAQGNAALIRIYAYYRIGLSGLLLLMFLLGLAPNVLGGLEPSWFLLTSTGFLLVSLISLPLLWKSSQELTAQQSFLLLIVDVFILVVLIHASGGIDAGLSPLLFVTIATGGIILHPQASAALAAITTLLMLGQTLFVIRLGIGDSRTLFTAGTLGFMLFICSLGFSYLSQRLRQSTEQVAAREAHLQHLQKLAQLIIERMQTGILVSSASGEVELINQSAAQLLNWREKQNGRRRLEDIPELEEHVRLWQTYPHSRAPNLKLADNSPEVRVRFAKLDMPKMASRDTGATLVYVEDTRSLNREAQQLKLASLGRLTASIAHEIRNPLGAISHASQLLAESPDLSTGDQRLTEIINNNTSRVNQIIENVLQLSRRKSTRPELVDLGEWLPQFIEDYRDGHSQTLELNLTRTNAPTRTRIDLSQLTQVITNLVDNGLRYSEKATGVATILLRLGTDANSDLAYLEIVDSGEGIAEDELPHIFEPFYTTEVSGSGLGLYLSRELCESNHATLNYYRDRDNKSCFRIDFCHPDRIF